MPSKTWKHKEAEFAALFGTVRRPLSGGNSSQGQRRDDALHPRLFLECKYAIRHAVWGLWKFARECCQREIRHPKRRPVVGLYLKGESTCLLVVHESDLLAVTAERVRQIGLDSALGSPRRAACNLAVQYLERIL